MHQTHNVPLISALPPSLSPISSFPFSPLRHLGAPCHPQPRVQGSVEAKGDREPRVQGHLGRPRHRQPGVQARRHPVPVQGHQVHWLRAVAGGRRREGVGGERRVEEERSGGGGRESEPWSSSSLIPLIRTRGDQRPQGSKGPVGGKPLEGRSLYIS